MNDPPIVWLFWVAFVAFIVGAIVVTEEYGGQGFWPVLVGGFGASLAAFLLALSWDHEKERRRTDQERERLREQLFTEARRRLEGIREELRRDSISLDMLALRFASGAPPRNLVLNPELLDFAWAANGARLSQILADVDLVSKLAITYGRIEELRWRLRQRTTHLAFAPDLAHEIAAISKLLIDELVLEVVGLRRRIEEEIAAPDVRLVGVVFTDAATVVSRAQVTSGTPAKSLSAEGTLTDKEL